MTRTIAVPPPPRSAPDDERDRGALDSRQRILEATACCIAESGVEGVRMAGIARAAGVSTALLHYHFATKDALFEHVLRWSYEATTHPNPAADRESGLPAPERLAAYLDHCIPSTPDLRRDLLLWQEFGAMSPRDAEVAAVTSDLFEGDVARVADIIRDGVRDGSFRDCDAVTVARAAVALCDGLNTRVLAGDPTTDLTEARRVLSATLAGLLGTDEPLPLVVRETTRKSREARR